MAVSIVLTGTGRSCSITINSPSIVVSSATGLVVGATIQGTGIPAGARIASISGTTITMANDAGVAVNATVTNATASLIFSSVWGSILTISMSASSDTANMDSIYSAGFGIKQRGLSTREILFVGAMGLEFKNIVAGAVFDFQNWTIECGSGGYWAWEQSSILGELRCGYLVNGTQFIKSSGATFIANNFKNSQAGGSNMFTGTATGTVTGNFRMNDLTIVYQVGSNSAPYFACGRMNCMVDNMILDYQAGSGANAGISAAFGYLNNTTIVKANSGIGNPNLGNYATITGLSYSGIFTDSPNHKFSIPNGYVLERYAPNVLSNQLLGGFQDNTTETFANIDLSTAGWGLNDLKTKYVRYGGNNIIKFPRTVSFTFKDSAANDLDNITLYIKSSSTEIINSVNSASYSANTQALVLNWTSIVGSYRVCNNFVDTINQVAQVRKYGYIEQSTSYSLNLAEYSQPFFLLQDSSLVNISETVASNITTAGINWATKTITPTANITYDQINARLAYELSLTTGSSYANPRSIVGSSMTLASGWTLVVNSGITVSAGTILTYLYVPTITLNGSAVISALYGSSAGNSAIIERTVTAGSTLAVWNKSTKTTIYYNSNVIAGTYRIYFKPNEIAEVVISRENYGYQRIEETLTPSGLNTSSYTDVEDVGITETNKATVTAYTDITDNSRLYDRTALFRLTEQGIKLGQIITKSGKVLETGTYSILLKQDASVVYAISSSLITIKTTHLDSTEKYDTVKASGTATITANTNEVINTNIEDANGDSSVTILGGDGAFELWKVNTSTATADYATGTKLGDFINTKYRFVGISGFDIVGVDINSNVRRRTSMSKGTYTQSFYVGDQIQLAQSPQVIQTLDKVNLIEVELEGIKGTGFNSSSNSLTALKRHVTNTAFY